MSVEMDERVAAVIAEGKRRAAERRAQITPEQEAAVVALVASVPELVARRWFCGPDEGKGRQRMWIAPKGTL